jgi:hypothetical protein
MKDKEREGLESGLIGEKTIYDLASAACGVAYEFMDKAKGSACVLNEFGFKLLDLVRVMVDDCHASNDEINKMLNGGK